MRLPTVTAPSRRGENRCRYRPPELTGPPEGRYRSSGRGPGVDGHGEAGHVPGLVGGQEEDGVGDVLGPDQIDRERVEEERTHVGTGLDSLGQPDHTVEHGCVDPGGMERV